MIFATIVSLLPIMVSGKYLRVCNVYYDSLFYLFSVKGYNENKAFVWFLEIITFNSENLSVECG